MSVLQKNSCKSIANSDPGKVLDLVISLEDDACSVLQTKINTYLRGECDAELVFSVVVNGARAEAYIEAVGSSVLEKRRTLSDCQKFVNILTKAHEQAIIFSDFHDDVKKTVSLDTSKEGKKHVLLVPVVDKPFSLVVCVIAPKEQQEHVVSFVYECFLLCWPAVKKTIQLEYELGAKQKCQQLLRVAKRLFTQVTSLDTLMKLTVEQMKRLINAEYCTLMLVDLDTMELVETCYPTKDTEATYERRFKMDRGIVGHVIKTGTVVNAKNVLEHPEYDSVIDNVLAIDIKTSLTFPIREQGGIIGVGQIINKVGGPYFDAMDEETALSFSVYCGISITDSVVYEKLMEANIRHMLATELIMYHVKVSEAEVSKVLDCRGYHNVPDFQSFYFNTRGLALRELPCYVMKMFSDLGFIRKFNLKQTKVAQFVLQVRKSYRDVPYHNWYHAFSAAQWAYAALINFQLVKKGFFTNLQAFMYFIACLTHDLDHRGAPSCFQINGQTTLSALYASDGSVMERYHLAQVFCILNTEGCDILEPLPRRDYDRALLMLRDFILATDLNNFFRNFKEYKEISIDYLEGNRSHIAALQALLMNAADLSDQLKEWGNVKKTAAEALTEFFNVSDLDKDQKQPFIVADDKCAIPNLEMQFLNDTCIPLYEMLANIFPIIAPATEVLRSHVVQWDGSTNTFSEVPVIEGLSVILSPDLDELIKATLEERERLRIEAEIAEQEAAAAAAAAAAAEAEEEN